jgi:hypothetical protein
MTIEIVDLPIENGGSFHGYVNVYQRVIIKMVLLEIQSLSCIRILKQQK